MIGLGVPPMFGSQDRASNPYAIWSETSTTSTQCNVNVLSLGGYVYYTSYLSSDTDQGRIVGRLWSESGTGTVMGTGTAFANILSGQLGSNLSAPSGQFLGRFGSSAVRNLRFLSSEKSLSATSQVLPSPFVQSFAVAMVYTDNYAYLINQSASAQRFASVSASYPYTITTLPVFSSEMARSFIAFRNNVYIKVGRSGAPEFSEIYVYREDDGLVSPVVGFNSAFGASAITEITFCITKYGVVFNIGTQSYLINEDRTYTSLGDIGIPSGTLINAKSCYDAENDVAFLSPGSSSLMMSVGGSPFVNTAIPAGNGTVDISVSGGVAIAATPTKIFVARV